MKKIFTLCFGLLAAVATQAQSDFPVQFADRDGNIIADGTTLTLNEYEEDVFGSLLVPARLYVKNTTDSEVQVGGQYIIQSMDNGVFQTCFPMNCILQTSVGTYETGNGVLAASALKDMQTEWYPDAEGTAVVSYQLVTYKQNPLTQKWTINEYGPTLTLNFSYGVSGVSVTFADQSAQSAPYYDLTGRRVLVPSNGIYVRNGRKVVVK